MLHTENQRIDVVPMRYTLTAGLHFALLLIVLVLSVIENLFLFSISLTSVHRWCLNRFRQRAYLDAFPSSNSFNKVPARKPIHFKAHIFDDKEDSRSLKLLPVGCSQNSIELECCSTSNHTNAKLSFSKERIGLVTRCYFGNLCLANLLLSLVAMPFSIAAAWGTSKPISNNNTQMRFFIQHQDNIILGHPILISDLTCTFIESTVSGILMVSILSLVQLTADRLIAICRPLQYSRWITRRRAILSIAFVWILSVILFALPHMCIILLYKEAEQNSFPLDTDIYRCFILGQHHSDRHEKLVVVYFTFIFAIPLLFFIISYIIIYLIVKRCAQKVNEIGIKQTYSHNEDLKIQNSKMGCDNWTEVPSEQNKISFVYKAEPIKGSVFPNESDTKLPTNSALQTKAAKTAFIFVSTFFFLTAPFFIFMLVGTYAEKTEHVYRRHNYTSADLPITQTDHSKSNYELAEIISSLTVWFLYVNSFLTPGLYSFRDGVIRRRIASLWKIGKINH